MMGNVMDCLKHVLNGIIVGWNLQQADRLQYLKCTLSQMAALSSKQIYTHGRTELQSSDVQPS